MMNWGTDPSVALYIGGPKDGQIGQVPPGRQERYVVVEVQTVYSFADPDPILPRYKYGTYEHARVVCDGQYYSVMADKQNYSLQDVSDRVLDEVMYGRQYRGIQTGYHNPGYHYGGYVSSPQQQKAIYDDLLLAKQWLSAMYDPPKKKSPEEALAWLHQTEGKDFL